jgi:pyridoxal phosphate enzyme (YggS family)
MSAIERSSWCGCTDQGKGLILAEETPCGQRETDVDLAASHRLLAERLAAIERRLRQACVRSGRSREDVTLVAVTKTVSAATAGLLPSLGILDLGESRPQELWQKASVIAAEVRWHLIGHLQRNKVERTLPLVCRIHSVDSLRLLDAVETTARISGRTASVLLEVNASREASKQGFRLDEVPSLAAPLRRLEHARVEGLMTMAASHRDPQRCRPTFVALRQARDRLQDLLGRPLPHLSMGMSNDFEVAVEEGATLVRLGTVLFEGLE